MRDDRTDDDEEVTNYEALGLTFLTLFQIPLEEFGVEKKKPHKHVSLGWCRKQQVNTKTVETLSPSQYLCNRESDGLAALKPLCQSYKS